MDPKVQIPGLSKGTADRRYLKLDQTTPQAVVNGSPIMEGVQFDTTPSTTNTAEGLLRWNSTDGTLDLGMSGGTVTQQLGQELFTKVRNGGLAVIPNGSVVYISGRTGVFPDVSLARSDSDSTSGVLGVATQDLPITGDRFGYVTTMGYVRGLKTDYTGTGNWGTDWAAGDKLYVSKTVAGQLTNIEPSAPHHSDVVGTVGVVAPAQGSILITLAKHKTLEELTDVNGTPLATTGQFPVWNQTAEYFDFDYNIVTTYTDTKEPTGFVDPDNIGVSYDSTARTITLTHAGGMDYYWRGVKKNLASPWVSTAHATGNDEYYLYSTDGTNFTWSTVMWTFDTVMVAFVNYGATNKYGRRETHGLMQWQPHEELHETIGTYLDSGGDLSGYTLSSTTAANRRPIVSSTVVKDEDLHSTLATLTSSLYTKHYVATASATSTYVVDTADIVPLSGANPYWNQYTGGAWQQTLMANNSYMAVWLIALPSTTDAGSQSYRYIWVQGQTNGTLAQIQSLTPTSLNVGQMTAENPEFVFIGKIIIRYTAGDWTIEQVDKLTGSRFSQVSLTGGVSGYVSKTGDTMTGDLRTTDLIKTRSSTLTYTAGNLTKVVKTGGRTIDYTYTSGILTSYTDGTNTWTLSYTGSDLTAITVT